MTYPVVDISSAAANGGNISKVYLDADVLHRGADNYQRPLRLRGPIGATTRATTGTYLRESGTPLVRGRHHQRAPTTGVEIGGAFAAGQLPGRIGVVGPTQVRCGTRRTNRSHRGRQSASTGRQLRCSRRLQHGLRPNRPHGHADLLGEPSSLLVSYYRELTWAAMFNGYHHRIGRCGLQVRQPELATTTVEFREHDHLRTTPSVSTPTEAGEFIAHRR